MNRIKTVLMVDDDPIFLALAKPFVRLFFPSASFIFSDNGEDALKRLEDYHPDLLFLDINMPVLTGWEFLAHLQHQGEKLTYPIFIATSSIDPSDLERAESNNQVCGFIEKPFSREKMEHVTAKVRNWYEQAEPIRNNGLRL